MDTTTTMTRRAPATMPLLTIAGAGAAVAVSLGVYANLHEPTGQGLYTFGFPAVLPMKAWFTTAAAALGLGQVLSALWLWDRLPGLGPAPAAVASAHRWLGTATFIATLPVAYHCLWALGFSGANLRVLVHSVLGCLFYGAFTTKMLALRSERLPPLTLPVVGGLLFALLAGLWATSSLWFFTTVGFPGV